MFPGREEIFSKKFGFPRSLRTPCKGAVERHEEKQNFIETRQTRQICHPARRHAVRQGVAVKAAVDNLFGPCRVALAAARYFFETRQQTKKRGGLEKDRRFRRGVVFLRHRAFRYWFYCVSDCAVTQRRTARTKARSGSVGLLAPGRTR